MKQNKPKTNWLIDAVLFGGFLLAQWLDLTGLPVHQWLGLGVAMLAGYHLAAHWSWVKAVTERFFGRTSRQARILRGGRRAGGRVRRHPGHRPGHLDLARSGAGQLRGLAHRPRRGLRRHAGPGGRQDRVALALDRRRGPAEHLPGPGANWSGGRGATRGRRGAGEPPGLRAADGGRGRHRRAGRRECAQRLGRRSGGGISAAQTPVSTQAQAVASTTVTSNASCTVR